MRTIGDWQRGQHSGSINTAPVSAPPAPRADRRAPWPLPVVPATPVHPLLPLLRVVEPPPAVPLLPSVAPPFIPPQRAGEPPLVIPLRVVARPPAIATPLEVEPQPLAGAVHLARVAAVQLGQPAYVCLVEPADTWALVVVEEEAGAGEPSDTDILWLSVHAQALPAGEVVACDARHPLGRLAVRASLAQREALGARGMIRSRHARRERA